MFSQITFDSRILGGKTCIQGMKIPESRVVNFIAGGMTQTEILKENPDIK